MLALLHIENIAVIEEADIEFDRGFNVLTGETGAGKSIVIDAIGAVIGERTSRELIRTGASVSVVSAVFRELPDLPWFSDFGIRPDENGELLVQRELHPDGRNTCRVNGKPVTVTQLRQLGTQLLNIHGQHDGQQLLDPAQHLSYLDAFGETGDALSAFVEEYKKLAALRREIDSLRMDEAEKSRRIDTLNYQITELERAELKPGEDEELAEKRKLMRSAGKISDAVSAACAAMLGGGGSDGALSLIGEAEGQVRYASRYADSLTEIGNILAQLNSDAMDAAERLRDISESFDFSAEDLDTVESRLDQLYRLKKKYGPSVEIMLEYLEKCRQELEEIESADDTIERLSRQEAAIRKETHGLAERLSKIRKSKAIALEERIRKELADLDMPKVRFSVEFAPKSGELGMDETGMDEVQFLMSANIGEDLKPIHKIASGGELARIMLALKNVLAETDVVTTMIFDEVDTGVSGRAALKVARKMANIAAIRQVLCVTHLPQIASMADAHFSVEKGERNGRTFTAVSRLTREQRCSELARLTGGQEVTEALMRSAEEMLTGADCWKAERKKTCILFPA